MATCRKAIEWLISSQKSDGSWGGSTQTSGSVEETALAVRALAQGFYPGPLIGDERAITSALERGTNWLIERVENGSWKCAFSHRLLFREALVFRAALSAPLYRRRAQRSGSKRHR